MRRPVVETGDPGMDDDQLRTELLGCTANPEIERRVLLFEIGSPDEDRVCIVDIVDLCPVDHRCEEV